MDFARKQLLKYGWSEGKGLGKNESGISEALKPTLKFDTSGVGHDSSEQFTFNWWENVYNQAADNIKVEKSNCGSVNLKLNSDDSIDITTKKISYKQFKKSNINLEYGSFLKTSKLVPEFGIVDHEEKVPMDSIEPVQTIKVANLTDEQLFAACGGRTAHKGARHGLKLNGKLARIEEQEMLLLQKMKQKANNLPVEENKMNNKYSLCEDDTQKIKHKKKKKKEKNDECDFEEASTKKQKKAKKRKSQPDGSDDDEEDNFIEEEAARKRTEYICNKQRKKKMDSLKKREKKRLNNMTNLFENVCSVNVQDNKDDGFVENTNDDDIDRNTKIKSKKKRRKHNEATVDENDDGFEECINEVSEKLIHYKELRMNLQKEKKKGDDNRISKMAEEFENTL